MARISAEQRRAALVQAALRVIAREGVAGATTRAITAEAKMPLASFHYAFRSRDELIAELIAFVVDNEVGAAATALTADHDLRTVVRDGLHAYLALVVSDPLREQAMFELTQYALRTPGLAGAARAQYDAYYRAAAEIISAIAEQTGIVWSRPLPQMARILITLTDGLTLGWLVDRDTAAAADVIDFAVDALVTLAAHPSPSPSSSQRQTS